MLAEVDRLNGLYTKTLENHNVEIIHERATVTGPHEVTLADGREVTAKTILIAIGARPHVPDCPGHEHGITSNEAFHLDALPKRILIAGARLYRQRVRRHLQRVRRAGDARSTAPT